MEEGKKRKWNRKDFRSSKGRKEKALSMDLIKYPEAWGCQAI